jgi:hypothetical protein
MAKSVNFTDLRARNYEPLSWLDGTPSRADIPSRTPRVATLAVPATSGVPKAIHNAVLYIALLNAFAGGFALHAVLASPYSVVLWVLAAGNLLFMVGNIYRFHSTTPISHTPTPQTGRLTR